MWPYLKIVFVDAIRKQQRILRWNHPRLILNLRQVSFNKRGKGTETQERRQRLGSDLQKYLLGFPSWLNGKESTCQCRRHGFDPWVGKVLWRRKWQPLQYTCLENPMDEEPGRLESMGSQKQSGTTKNNDKTKHLLPQKFSTILPYCHQDLSMFMQTFQSFRSMRWNSRVCCCFELSYVPGSISLSGREKGAEVHVHFQICITQRISFWIFLTCFSRVMMLHIPHSVILIPKLTCFIMSQESNFLKKSSLCSCWTVMTLGWLSFLGMIWWSNSHSGDGGFRLGGLDMCVLCYSSRR